MAMRTDLLGTAFIVRINKATGEPASAIYKRASSGFSLSAVFGPGIIMLGAEVLAGSEALAGASSPRAFFKVAVPSANLVSSASKVTSLGQDRPGISIGWAPFSVILINGTAPKNPRFLLRRRNNRAP